MFALIASIQKFTLTEDLIHGFTIAILRMPRVVRARHSLAEIRQDPATYLGSRNIAPEFKNLRVAVLIIQNKRLRSLIVSFNIGSSIARHEVDRNAAPGRRGDRG